MFTGKQPIKSCIRFEAADLCKHIANWREQNVSGEVMTGCAL